MNQGYTKPFVICQVSTALASPRNAAADFSTYKYEAEQVSKGAFCLALQALQAFRLIGFY